MKASKRPRPPAQDPERREKQLVALAVDLAEKQLRDGTATSQVITHFLKLGSEQNSLELEKMRRENELLTAKTDNLKSMAHIEELYEQAMHAMMDYSGGPEEDEEQY